MGKLPFVWVQRFAQPRVPSAVGARLAKCALGRHTLRPPLAPDWGNARPGATCPARRWRPNDKMRSQAPYTPPDVGARMTKCALRRHTHRLTLALDWENAFPGVTCSIRRWRPNGKMSARAPRAQPAVGARIGKCALGRHAPSPTLAPELENALSGATRPARRWRPNDKMRSRAPHTPPAVGESQSKL